MIGDAAAQPATAWSPSEEIESLAGEIVRNYEELHLLYELGELLTGQLTVAAVGDLIVEKLLHTLRAEAVELRLSGRGRQKGPILRKTADQRPAAARERRRHGQERGSAQRLSATLRSGGEMMGTIVLVRAPDDAPFTSADGKLLDGVGALAANGMRNAHLYEELQRQSVHESEAHLRALMDNVADAIIAVGQHGAVESFNLAAERLFGYACTEIIGKPFAMLIPVGPDGDDAGDLEPWLCRDEGAQTGAPPREAVGRRHDGATFAMDVAVSEMRCNGKRLFIVSVHDITERKQAEAALARQALYDALTNLPNRTLLYDRLQHAILNAHRDERSSLALLMLDLDRFKEVNDTFGHHRGDLLLQQIGPRLQGTLRKSDTIARLGGDEFAVLVPGADRNGATLAARKLLRSLERPFVLEGQRLDVASSIGIALYPDHGLDAQTLLRHADVAMYVAKRNTRAYAVYAFDQDTHSPARLALVGELRQAIDQTGLMLYYQPKVSYKTGRVTDLEALVRWQHPAQGFLLPDQFVPMSEQTGLIKPLGTWVLNAALRQCRAWLLAGVQIPVAVNLSMRNLHDLQLPNTISKLLEMWDVPPGLLKLEITESSLMANPERALHILTRLCGMGVQMAIDDFGTGYSSLTYLKRLPVHELKIDKSFVMQMAVDESDAAIVRSTIALGHDLGLAVVAEGVENQLTWDMLSQFGCDLAQGYFVCRPVPAAELTRWLNASPWSQAPAGASSAGSHHRPRNFIGQRREASQLTSVLALP